MKRSDLAAIALTLTVGIATTPALAQVVEVPITANDGVEEYRPAPGSPDYDPADYGQPATATAGDVIDIGTAVVVERAPLALWLVGGVS